MATPEDTVFERNINYQKLYEVLGTGPFCIEDELHEEIEDSKIVYLRDFDKSKLNLLLCNYKFDKNQYTVLVKKGAEDDKIDSTTYKHLLLLKHPLMIPVKNFYDKGNWLVLGRVNGSLRSWLQDHEGWALMFEGTGSDCRMSSVFRNLVINMWSLRLKMEKQKLYPKKFKFEDFFVKLVADNMPKFHVLLTQFQELSLPSHSKEQSEETWNQINAIIDTICTLCGRELNMVSKKFCEYIKGTDKLVEVTHYPDNWSVHDKASYLYQIIANNREVMSRKINYFSGVGWPRGSDGKILWVLDRICYLPHNTFQVLEAGEIKIKSKYDEQYPYDYIKLCRDNHKHFFGLPKDIQLELGGNPEAFIGWMERQNPSIWTLLYEAIGPLGREI